MNFWPCTEKPEFLEDGRPICGFGNCTAPFMAAAVVGVRPLGRADSRDEASHWGVLLICELHWDTAPQMWQ